MAQTKIQNLNEAELKAEEVKTAEQIFRLRFQQGLGQLEGVSKLKSLKKDVARIKTLQRQRALGIAAPVEAAAPKAKKSAAKKTKKAE